MAAAGGEDAAIRVEKTMALSPAEFANSLATLLGRPVAADGGPVGVSLGRGQVVVSYERMPGVRLGGLLELPRARVVLAFVRVPAADRAAFIARFDVAFQRGGG